ncbi:MAG TPA: ECF-type sigma factor [Gemmataceae bacterium]|nr:ECF-type sigma factor [Gemmataceae bacterium]
MSSEGSISRWVTALKEGDAAAAQPLWERYHRRLVTLARQKLQAAHRRAADEEDVVQNAFHSFFRGVSAGRFPQLNDRDNLWRLLVVITARKALDQLARDHRKRRGGGTVQGESGIFSRAADWDAAAIERIVGDEPTPDFAAQVAEEYHRLLDLLGDESLCQVAVWKMEGLTNDEVAEQLGCSRRTVARKLDTIRIIWSEEPTP